MLLHVCVTCEWRIVYISYLKKSSFIIYSLVLLISFLSIFSISLKRKRDNYKGRTLKWKRKTSRTTTPTWTVRSSIKGMVVSILNLFHYENTRHKLFIANFISLDQDVWCFSLFVFKSECIRPIHPNTWCISLGGAYCYILIILRLIL